MIANSSPASPTVWRAPLVAATAIPKRSGGASRSAGYTDEVSPSVFARNRSYASSTSARTSSGRGSCPVET